MFGAFAAAKVKAFQATKLFSEGGYEVLQGGSHASGDDVPLFTRNGVQRRAEGGEALAIFSKAAVRKYGTDLPDIVHKINRMSLDVNAFKTPQVGAPNVILNAPGSKDMEQDIKAMRRQGERSVSYDGKGRKVEKYKNLTRVYA